MVDNPILKLKPVLSAKRRGNVLHDMYSFVPYEDAYIGMFRIDIAGRPGGGGMGFVTLKKIKDAKLVIEKKDINPSLSEEDPRVFLYKGHPYALFWTGAGKDFYLVDLVLKNPAKIDTTRLGKAAQPYLGKNWVAVEKDGELYFIFSLQPLTVLKYDFTTQKVRLYYSEEGMIPRRIGIIRGGTSFVRYKNAYISVARATISPDIHIPIVTILSADLRSVRFKEPALVADNAIYKKTGNVFDPLSIWKKGTKIEVVINRYSEFSWVSPEVHVLVCALTFVCQKRNR